MPPTRVWGHCARAKWHSAPGPAWSKDYTSTALYESKFSLPKKMLLYISGFQTCFWVPKALNILHVSLIYTPDSDHQLIRKYIISEPRSRHVGRVFPQVAQMIWNVFGRAEVDHFALEDNSHCPVYLLRGKRCSVPQVAQQLPVCLPYDCTAPSCHQKS